MDTRVVTAAAIACLVIAVGFSSGAIASGGVDPRYIGIFGAAFTVLAVGLPFVARLYTRLDRMEDTVTELVAALGDHKEHDRAALRAAADLAGPNELDQRRGN